MTNVITSKNEVKAQFDEDRVQQEATPEEVEKFLEEAVVMQDFDHPNVVSLLGISLFSDNFCILMPLMSNGNLHQYVKAKVNVIISQAQKWVCLLYCWSVQQTCSLCVIVHPVNLSLSVRTILGKQ